MPGRPVKLTAEVQKRLIEALTAGNYYQAACAYAGIDYSTFRRWMIRGKKAKSGPFREFCEAVRAAVAKAELAIVTLWRAECPGNYQACRDFLDRRHPRRWGKHEKMGVEVSGKLKVEARHEHDISAAINELATAYDALAAQTEPLAGDPGRDGVPQPVDP